MKHMPPLVVNSYSHIVVTIDSHKLFIHPLSVTSVLTLFDYVSHELCVTSVHASWRDHV